MNKEFLQSLNESLLVESGLSRVWKQTREHDYGTITAFRSAEDCNKGKPYTKADNMKRNKSLVSKLQSLRYGITKIKGSYIENYGSQNEKEVGENSFIVIDLQDKGSLKRDLLKLGEEFEQDSIIFGNAGKAGVLFGTNKCPDGYPGFGKKVKQGGAIFGEKGEFMSRVKGRPFIFADKSIKENIENYGFKKYPTELRGVVEMSKLHWSDIDI